MPCTSDYLEPNKREVESRETRELLCYLLTALGQPVLRVGDVLRYRRPDWTQFTGHEREDHEHLLDGQLVQVTRIHSVPRPDGTERFQCRPFPIPSPLRRPPTRFYSSTFFTKLSEDELRGPEVRAALREAENQRREIECPKVDLP